MASQRRRSTRRLTQTTPRPCTQTNEPLPQPPPAPAPTRSPFHYLHAHLLTPTQPPTTHTLSTLPTLPPSTATVHVTAVVLSIPAPLTVHTRRGDDVALVKLSVGDHTSQYVSVDLWGLRARWADCLRCGDVVHWRAVRVQRWRDRVGLAACGETRFTILERRGGWDEEDAKDEFAQRWRLPFAAPAWLQQHIKRLNEWVKSQHGGLLYLPPRLSQSQIRHRLSTSLTPTPPRSALNNPASLPALTIHELLHGRLDSGFYRLPCRVRRLYFPDLPFFSPSPSLLLSSLPPLSSLASLVYRGCQRCGLQLVVDANGVWRTLCDECVERDETLLASDQAAVAALSWYYRPMHVQVVDGRLADGADLWLQLSHSVILQMLVNLPASLWAVQESSALMDDAEPPQQQPPRRQGSSRRLSKRRRHSQSTDAQLDADCQHNPPNPPQPQPHASDQPLPCTASTDGRVLSCSCHHERCQWLGLLCALVDERAGCGAADGCEAALVDCTLTWLLRVNTLLDENGEVSERHHAVVGCSIQHF